jgi:DNA polymerase III epsilon subunit-like protein
MEALSDAGTFGQGAYNYWKGDKASGIIGMATPLAGRTISGVTDVAPEAINRNKWFKRREQNVINGAKEELKTQQEKDAFEEFLNSQVFKDSRVADADAARFKHLVNDGGMSVDGWVVDGEDKFNLVRENAKKYARQGDLYLFFDTETTGTPLNYKAPSSDTRNWPRLVQLGWILMTKNGKKVSEKSYIVKPKDFTIPADATKIHKITTKMALEQGRELSFVIDEFLKDFNKAKYIVGHNIDFDKKIVGAELIRLSRPDVMDSKKAFCTMKSSIDFCKIPGYYGYKYPKLQELYHKLFGRDFEEAHNATSDIEATQQCFWELRKRGLI